MKKSFLVLLVIVFTVVIVASCGADAVIGDSTTDSEIVAEDPYTEETTEKEDSHSAAICEIHHQDYHTIPLSLIEYIGEKDFHEWAELDEGKELIEGCSDNKTIYDLIHYFDVPRHELEEVYHDLIWGSVVWNIDALYAEDKFVSDQFYRNVDMIDMVLEKRRALLQVKRTIAEWNWDEWTALYGNIVPGSCHSVAYLVKTFDVLHDELQVCISSVISEHSYEYDIDALYTYLQNGEEKLTPIEEDALFCGFDDLYIE